MQFLTLLFVVGLTAISTAQEPIKSCLRSTDECTATKETTAGILRKLRALDTTTEIDIPKRINELHSVFEGLLQTDCKTETCKCTDGKLDCHVLRDDVRALLTKIELPQCIIESPIAAKLLGGFRKAVEEGDRAKTLSVLNLLEKLTTSAVSKGDNTKMVECIKTTVQNIRAPVQETVQKFDLQPDCDFCAAA